MPMPRLITPIRVWRAAGLVTPAALAAPTANAAERLFDGVAEREEDRGRVLARLRALRRAAQTRRGYDLLAHGRVARQWRLMRPCRD